MADDWIQISPQPLDVNAATRFVTDANAGGITIFLGITRAETGHAGNQLLALDYEAYADMAAGQLRALASAARQKWPVLKIALLHRIGRVAVGEPSVVIAVSTPHRAEAFGACHWLIDELKKDVAIWKKEIWTDGTGRWV